MCLPTVGSRLLFWGSVNECFRESVDEVWGDRSLNAEMLEEKEGGKVGKSSLEVYGGVLNSR